MGRTGVGMPSGTSEQRHQANIESVRRLVDAGSPDIIRDAMGGSAIGVRRRKYPLPSVGHRSGKLTVTGYIAGSKGGVRALLVRCDCNEAEYGVALQSFKDFKSTRCPICAKKAASDKRYQVYSEAMPDDAHRTRLLRRLSAAINRCHSPTSRVYKHHDQRGIKVYEGWRADRTAFLKYVQTLSGWDNPSFEMERINTDGNYEPGNIRFAPRSDDLKVRQKVEDLEARIRHIEQRLKEQVYDPN